MKRLILKSLFCATLCSIVALTPCQAEVTGDKKYKSVKKLAQGKNAYRWQQQLRWIADAYNAVFPDLKLLGWREVGPLTNQEQIDQFIRESIAEDRLCGHTVFGKDGEIESYEIATLAELAKKYPTWADANFEDMKKIYGKKLESGAKIIELKWQYKDKEFVEKAAVTDKHEDMGGIIYHNIRLAVDSRKVPQADWQKTLEYSSMSNINFDNYDKIEDDYWKGRFDQIKLQSHKKGLTLKEYKYIGVIETEEQKEKFLKKCIADKSYVMWYNLNSNPRYNISKFGDLKSDDPKLYDQCVEHTKVSLRSLKLKYDRVIRLKWEYEGEQFVTYAFVTSYVPKLQSSVGQISSLSNKSFYLVYDNMLKVIDTTNASFEKRGRGRVYRYSSITRG